jgi:hypothetical protein
MDSGSYLFDASLLFTVLIRLPLNLTDFAGTNPGLRDASLQFQCLQSRGRA